MNVLLRLTLAAAAAACMTASAATAMAADAVTGTYDPETGHVGLVGVESSGNKQTLLILNQDIVSVDEVTKETVVQIDQKDGIITQVKLPAGIETLTDDIVYYIRIGGSDGSIQTGTITIEPRTMTVIFSDANRDSLLNGTDITMLARAIVGSTKNKGLAGKELTIDGVRGLFSDANDDSLLNGTDITMLARAIVGSTKNKGKAGVEVQIPIVELAE